MKAFETQIQNVRYKSVRRYITKEIKFADGTVTVEGTYFTEPEETARIIFSDKYTIVILEDGSKGVAKCHDNDLFNPRLGVKLAYARAKVAQVLKETEIPEIDF